MHVNIVSLWILNKISLFTDPLFSLQSPSIAGDKTSGDLLIASADVF